MCWADLQVYATLVRPETILAWHRKLVALKYTAKRKIRTAGQKRMEVIRELCVKFAEENPGWGYGCIQGALANVGYKISGTTVGNILRDKGIFPSPERGKQSNRKRFIRSHMDVTAVADFFAVEVWTLRGLVRYHVFFVMKLAQRQVEIVHIGCQVDGHVMAQLARNLTDGFDGYLKGIRFFVCDHNPLYTAAFRQVLKDSGIKVIQTRIGCPQQNGYAESFVSTIKRVPRSLGDDKAKRPCLDHLILFREKSLRRAIREYMEHFHQERNHQGLDNQIPFTKSLRSSLNTGLIVKSERLGGLLKNYHRETEKEGQEAA